MSSAHVPSVRGMHPMEAVSFFNSDGEGDPEASQILARERARRKRRKMGKPLAVVGASRGREYSPPCSGCAFADHCKAKALACNHFAEWAVNKRPIPSGIKRLLPSRTWMRVMHEAETVEHVRVAYDSIVNRQTQQEITP